MENQLRNPIRVASRSTSIKALVIAILILALLIPVRMINGVVFDRRDNQSIAVADIQNSWGGVQTISGPVLKLPYRVEDTTVYGLSYANEKVVYLLAKKLRTHADVTVEERYRGMHEVPVFNAAVTTNVRFDFTSLDSLGIEAEQLLWSDAELYLGISDPMAISEIPRLVANGAEVEFTTGGESIGGVPSELRTLLGRHLDRPPPDGELEFNIVLNLNGSGALSFLPLADHTAITMSGNWSSPSFVGRQLPAHREVRDDGFDASWTSTRIGRKLPSAWIERHEQAPNIGRSAFGARFIQPVDLYQVIERSIKYAVLIIGLTFVAYFLMEVICNLRLHPLQYLQVGLANTLFYLLLLSLSEHLGFDAAYVLSASASTALIAGYSAAILRGRSRAIIMTGMLVSLYAFLYLTLKAENLALLAGSFGLWVVLAIIMYVTRGIDWYGAGNGYQKQADADPDERSEEVRRHQRRRLRLLSCRRRENDRS